MVRNLLLHQAKEEEEAMKNADHWDWAGGFCKKHRGNELPCRVCVEAGDFYDEVPLATPVQLAVDGKVTKVIDTIKVHPNPIQEVNMVARRKGDEVIVYNNGKRIESYDNVGSGHYVVKENDEVIYEGENLIVANGKEALMESDFSGVEMKMAAHWIQTAGDPNAAPVIENPCKEIPLDAMALLPSPYRAAGGPIKAKGTPFQMVPKPWMSRAYEPIGNEFMQQSAKGHNWLQQCRNELIAAANLLDMMDRNGSYHLAHLIEIENRVRGVLEKVKA
jgi:hypothetical protein